MATQTLTLLRQRNYSGAHTYGPAKAPAQLAHLLSAYLHVESATFTDPSTQITVVVQESLDGGVTWRDACAFAGGGTTALNKAGDGPAVPGATYTPTPGANALQGTVVVTGTVNFALVADLTWDT